MPEGLECEVWKSSLTHSGKKTERDKSKMQNCNNPKVKNSTASSFTFNSSARAATPVHVVTDVLVVLKKTKNDYISD